MPLVSLWSGTRRHLGIATSLGRLNDWAEVASAAVLASHDYSDPPRGTSAPDLFSLRCPSGHGPLLRPNVVPSCPARGGMLLGGLLCYRCLASYHLGVAPSSAAVNKRDIAVKWLPPPRRPARSMKGHSRIKEPPKSALTGNYHTQPTLLHNTLGLPGIQV